jgi:hypothetical protein
MNKKSIEQLVNEQPIFGALQGNEEAMEQLLNNAKRGDADAMYGLGFTYKNHRGHRSDNDLKQAIIWYDKAAEKFTEAANQGNADAQYKLSAVLRDKYNLYAANYKKIKPELIKQARVLLTSAAEQGHANAQYTLGLKYSVSIGDGFPVDKKKAIYWLTKAVENGVAEAQESLNNAKKSCYVATCVYGSYDCPQVWTLRRYRDNRLSKSWLGRMFIRVYYAISPKVVELFGNRKWFNRLCKPIIDSIVRGLQNSGIGGGPYSDV